MNNFEFMEASRAKLKECWDKLQERSHLSRPIPTLSFDLRGRSAGEASGGTSIRLNLAFAAKYADDMINQTVPHEAVHCWLFAINDPSHVTQPAFSTSFDGWGWEFNRRTKRSPHGQTFMYTLGTLGCRQERTHHYDVSEAGVSGHKYGCNCPGLVHVISTRKHNILKSGRRVWCKRCKADLHKI